jgi:DNA-binding response OmpR family regulator
MDLRVMVLTPHRELGDLVRAQVENLGCRCMVAETFEECVSSLDWAEAAVVDLAGDGLADLNRIRLGAPLARVLAVAPDELMADAARKAGVSQTLVEPFSIAELVDAVRALAPVAEVVDLRTGERAPAPAADDAPWWATR